MDDGVKLLHVTLPLCQYCPTKGLLLKHQLFCLVPVWVVYLHFSLLCAGERTQTIKHSRNNQLLELSKKLIFFKEKLVIFRDTRGRKEKFCMISNCLLTILSVIKDLKCD